MIGFWLSIVNGKESKLSNLLYSIMLKEHEKGSYNFKWILCINDTLVAVGRPDLFKTEPVNLFFKDILNFEKYLINVSKFYYSKIIKYRTGNHRLPVETGRWDDIPLNERKCKICTTDDIGDEYHYLFT